MPLNLNDDLPTKLLDKFMSFVEVDNGCWLWRGVKNPQGYGMFSMNSTKVCAHRVSYSLFTAEIPSGLVVDHTCHNKDNACSGGHSCVHRSCVNPKHLEAITQRENLWRSSLFDGAKAHCKHGHLFSLANTMYENGRNRRCKTCYENKKSRMREKWRMTHAVTA